MGPSSFLYGQWLRDEERDVQSPRRNTLRISFGAMVLQALYVAFDMRDTLAGLRVGMAPKFAVGGSEWARAHNPPHARCAMRTTCLAGSAQFVNLTNQCEGKKPRLAARKPTHAHVLTFIILRVRSAALFCFVTQTLRATSISFIRWIP